MSKQNRNDYLSLRRQYEPESVRLVIVAESPPASGLYFYDPTGVPSESLFAAFMRQLRLSLITKEAGLREFQRRGWVLVDATYQPVNALSDAARNKLIARYYPLLRDDLAKLLPDRSVPLVLIKANVCRILGPKLAEDGFNVLNGGRVVYFPSHGQQRKFAQQFSAVLKSAGIDSAAI